MSKPPKKIANIKVLSIGRAFLSEPAIIIEVHTKNRKRKYRMRKDDVIEVVE